MGKIKEFVVKHKRKIIGVGIVIGTVLVGTCIYGAMSGSGNYIDTLDVGFDEIPEYVPDVVDVVTETIEI